MATIGIYTITAPSGNQYVGSSSNIEVRWKQHIYKLKCGTHKTPALLASFKKYGLAELKFQIIFECLQEDLFKYEQYYIDLLSPAYNLCRVAGSTFGLKYSEQARKNLSDAQTPERRAAKSKTLTGIKRSAETCVKISEARKGVSTGVKSEETRAKLSAANKGKTHSAEWCANSSKALKGLNKGIPKPEGFGEKISLARSISVMCVENNMIFRSSKLAGEWCLQNGFTNSDRAHSMIIYAVQHNKTAYGLTWKKVEVSHE